MTGSSSGIGQAIAIECAKAGGEVLIHYRKNKKGAEETLREVEKYSKGIILSADLSKQEEVEKMFKKIKVLDVLINNAGQYKGGKLEDFDLWQWEFQNIFFSIIYMVNCFLKTTGSSLLRKIVNISSVYALQDTGTISGMQYSAAKAALNSLTANLAKKLAPNILVNAVAPGYTWTPIWEGTTKEDMSTATGQTRIKRYIEPKEIASMVLELLRNDAVTGEIIRVDGGHHLTETY